MLVLVVLVVLVFVCILLAAPLLLRTPLRLTEDVTTRAEPPQVSQRRRPVKLILEVGEGRACSRYI